MKKDINIRYNVNIKKTVMTFSKLLILFLIVGSSIAVAETDPSDLNKISGPGLAPENPDFVKYRENRLSSQSEPSLDESLNGHEAGLIPAPLDLSYLSETTAAELSAPASYDLRTLNKVTNVRDQGSAGTCWVFATYASLESYLKPGENRDFSENNVKNLLSSSYPEGFDRSPTDGGNNLMSTAYLARWSGPLDETDDPYSASSGTSPTGLPSKKHVQDVLFIPDRQGSLDNEGIKSAVQNYGAVFTSMYYSDTYYSPTTYGYYYDGNSTSNHAVAIVGWDDNFDKNRFSKVPPGNGAFIIKNSWGSRWGENGYFYISYYDSKIGASNSVFTGEDTGNYGSIYQYDPLGWVQNVGYSGSTAWCANVFTAKSDEALKAVSFYTTDSNCNYEVYAYTDPGSGPIGQSGPGLLKSGVIPLAGYHTVPLSSEVQLRAGQKFSVVLKLTTSGYTYPIAIEKPSSGYSSKAKSNAGESFVSSDGNKWNDLTSYYANTNVCLKAFTKPVNSQSPIANFSSNVTGGPAPLSVQFMDLSKNAASLSWDFDNNGQVDSTDKNPVYVYTTPGTYTVKLTATNTYGTNSKSATITVSEKPVSVLPVADFKSNVTSGYIPLSVQFADLSKNATRWKWDFGDGSNSTVQSPTHTYSAAGSYSVTLTASNEAGTDTETKTGYINVNPVSSTLAAAFSASPTSGKAPLRVQFTDASTGSPTSWRWNFGDRTYSTAKNPVHTYKRAGKYTVSLTVRNSRGNSNTKTMSGYIVVS